MASSDSEKEEAEAAAAVAEEEARAREKQYWKYAPLYKAALIGDWEEAERIIDGDGDALTAEITQYKEIALHVAVATDIALDLVRQYPQVAKSRFQHRCALGEMSKKVSAFRSGSHFNHWQSIIYYYAPVKVEESAEYSERGDIENPSNKCGVTAHKYNWTRFLERMFSFSERQKVKDMLWRVSELLVPPIKHIRELKLKHNQALKLVKYLCEQVRSLEDLEAYRSLARNPLLVAAKLGIHEIIEEIVNSFPTAILDQNSEDRNIFELAVIKRHENVFNLLYQMGEYKQYITRLIDNEGNTLLHLVGNKAPIEKLNVVPGAALQMQRELQWFKEVEKFVNPSYIEMQNDDGETPSTVFTNKHMDLVVEGEKWMKNRATSCTFATTLITAIVFAAAMTVPGGNNNTSGLPIFSTEKAFIVFLVSDAIALFMSTTSLLIFLSILTSRYAEDDFLYVLPHRLIVGFVTLFLSIITMIVAFSSTLCLMLGDKNSWLLSLVVTSACLPISSFMLLQFPLLVDLMSSTYGPGIFGKQSNRSFY
ncbi:uncharacterized protein LOC114322525 isoform X3 [Camellia sinensis]|uniref:uncharacterized protein LOC114322525 isoform X3 n=1 Tax=Camellia sinensis TaxID=4442 RepID=UPI001035C842|nr:uncharacterized protein LOC114322525 isoform X3 [Camellia sinensis]